MIRGCTVCLKKKKNQTHSIYNTVLPHLTQSITEKLETNHILMDLHYNYRNILFQLLISFQLIRYNTKFFLVCT